MSTRALTIILNEQFQPLVNIFCSADGYPQGHGADLARIIKKDRILVNGITSPEQENASNGMGCLAATIVAGLKTEIGHIYLKDAHKDYGQEYEYHIRKNGARIIDVNDNRKMIFDGDWNDFYDFCVSQYLSLFFV